MDTQPTDKKNSSAEPGFFGYASWRLSLVVLLIAALTVGSNVLIEYLDLSPPGPTRPDALHSLADAQPPAIAEQEIQVEEKKHVAPDTPEDDTDKIRGNGTAAPPTEANPSAEEKPIADPTHSPSAPAHEQPATRPDTPPDRSIAAEQPAATPEPPAAPPTDRETYIAPPPAIAKPAPHNNRHPSASQPMYHPPQQQAPLASPPAAQHAPPRTNGQKHSYRPTGVAFVEAVMHPIDYELNQRFFGWRPNDIINLTDNANNFQLGVLEVTRRSAVQLTERISRTGSTDAFNNHLENAMNWLMVKADRYWFPAPESKYRESLKELEAYKQNLISGTASFHTRADNLIPLLMAYEDLLGSSDENLVKNQEMDGTTVSTFAADDYFYYAKGVASTMVGILEAIHHDFESTLDSRNGSELLHHAIESCRIAADLDPWFITNSNLDGFFANHRANMAAPISHARFYIGQLIKTLST